MVSFDAKIPAVSPVTYTAARMPGAPGEKLKTPGSDFKTGLFQFTADIKFMSGRDLEHQNALFHFNRLPMEEKQALVYEGRPISELSAGQAADLIKEDGFFGVAKTAARITDFVLTGAGNDLDRLKAGRDGILKGFQEAEKLWGGKLPPLSYETLEKSLEAVDERIKDLGGSVVDLTA